MINKQEIIEHVASSTRAQRGQTEEIINSFLDSVIDKMSMGEKVHLAGFGTFEVKERKGRAGVDPRTLKPMQIPTVNVAKFRPGKTLKEAVK